MTPHLYTIESKDKTGKNGWGSGLRFAILPILFSLAEGPSAGVPHRSLKAKFFRSKKFLLDLAIV
jgi:hypothetical protein